VLSGGEPTVYKHFLGLIDFLSGNNQYFSIVTNGFFTDKVETKLIEKHANIIELKFSLDGYDYSTYSYLRGSVTKSEFSDLLRRIHRFIGLNFWVTLGIVLHSKTICKVREFCKLINTINPKQVHISFISNSGRAKDLTSKDKMVSISDVERVKREFKENLNPLISVSFVDMPFTVEKDSRFGFSCPAISDFFAVDSQATLLPCPLFNAPEIKGKYNFANLTQSPLCDAVNKKIYRTLLDSKTKPCIHNSKKCNNIDSCQRCIAQSIIEGGIYRPPEFCQQFSRELFNDL
jgi:MoaA/NifB/PqqE/SkfB family radical SAM enzyme